VVWDDIQQNYAGKLYICAFFDMVCKLEMRYLFEQDPVPAAHFKRNSATVPILTMEFLIALKIQQKVIMIRYRNLPVFK
jgi:hypothetical protein